jgi:hypothetical protein
VFISGQLNGRLTIAAKNSIYITADLTYSHGEDTFNDPNSDMLGLIADNYVYILHHWSNTGTPPQGEYPYDAKHVAPDDIHIDAAILTVNHSYGFEDHDDTDDSKKGTIYLKGSIAQNYRGAVGLIGSTGYLKDYDYDPRMKYRQPPHYISPANSGFEIISWKQIN